MEAVMQATRAVRYEGPSLETLYESAFPAVAKFVGKMNGTFDDAKDIFQDALVIYYEKQHTENIVLHSSPEAYVLGIAKHLWLKKFTKATKHVSLNDVESRITLPDDFYPTVHTTQLLAVLEQTGKRCLDLLQAFYYDKLTVASIAKRFGLGSEHSASVQKYKCLEKVRDTVKSKSMRYEDFFE